MSSGASQGLSPQRVGGDPLTFVPVPHTVAFAIGGSPPSLDAAALCERLGALVEESGATCVLCDARAIAAVDIQTVDTLARLRLTARRLGCELRVAGASTALLELLGFVGLAAVVVGLEPGRQAEEREERVGVEERGELDDATA
jgi:hypothetical protein